MRTLVAVLALLAVAPPVLAGQDAPLEARGFDLGALLFATRERAVERLGLDSKSHSGDFDTEVEDPRYVSFADGDALTELIPEVVAPASWDEEGAVLRVLGDRLDVRARPEVLAGVESLLGSLWREASRRVAFDVRRIEVEAGALDAKARAALLRGRLDPAALERVLAKAKVAARGSAVARPGVRGTVRQVNAVSYVSDFAVEIAQGSTVGDPVIGWAREGLLADVRAHLLTDGDLLLEVLGQTAALEGPIRHLLLEAERLGAVDLPACARERFFTAARLSPGETLAVVRSEGPDETLHAVLVTPRVRGAEGPEGGPRFFPVSGLVADRLGYRVERPDEEEPTEADPYLLVPDEEGPYLDEADLTDLLEARVLSESREESALLRTIGGGLLASAEPSILAAAEDALRAVEAGAAATWRVHVSIGREDEAGPRSVASLHLDATPGRSVCYDAGVERAFVADWDVEVAQESRVGDPEIGHAFGGVALNLRVDPTPDPDAVCVQLELTLARLDPVFAVRRTRNDVTGVIEIPSLSRIVLDRDLVLEPGKRTVIEAGGGTRVEVLVER